MFITMIFIFYIALLGSTIDTVVPENLDGSGFPRQTNNKDCQFPAHPPHGYYRIEDDVTHQYKPEDNVPKNTIIVLDCDSSYTTLMNLNFFVCRNGLWSPQLSTCHQTCPTLTSTESTKISCSYKNINLETCDNPIEGTVATLNCDQYYENHNDPFCVCQNGQWSGTLQQCVPICGQRTSVGRTNIINGTNVVKGSYPWHVGIYTSDKEYICGGSLLSQRIILTAAHCLSDNNEGTPYPKENYSVAAGKYYREYDDPGDQHAQYPTIETIHVPTEYRGVRLQHESDIAVIVLTKNLVLSDVVQPVCVDWLKRYEFEQLFPNNQGVVTGWGYTMEGKSLSKELKELIVPLIPFNECFYRVPKNFTKFVHSDKICGGYLDSGTAVCGGDSGGGLTFPRLATERYFIRGIVSVSPATRKNTCNSRQYGLYTSVSKHLDFVKQVYTSNIVSLPPTRSESCRIPESPSHGKFVVGDNEGNVIHSSGNFVPVGSVLSITCDLHYHHHHSSLLGFSTCKAGKWHPDIGSCSAESSTGSDNIFTTASSSSRPLVVGDKSRQKCQEYAKSVESEGCAIGAADFVSQMEANLKEFPHLALIYYTNHSTKVRTYCGGSLISDKFVLTTANCVDPKNAKTYNLIFGYLMKQTPTSEIQFFNSTKTFIHPGYHSESRYNNIALLELGRRVKFTAYIRPACLNSIADLNNHGSLVSTSWKNYSSGQQSDVFLKSTVETLTNSECNNSCGIKALQMGILEDLQYCAIARISREKPKPNFSGYDGDLLQIMDVNVYCMHNIIGFQSFACRTPIDTAVFTRVSAYIKWIEDIVWP